MCMKKPKIHGEDRFRLESIPGVTIDSLIKNVQYPQLEYNGDTHQETYETLPGIKTITLMYENEDKYRNETRDSPLVVCSYDEKNKKFETEKGILPLPVSYHSKSKNKLGKGPKRFLFYFAIIQAFLIFILCGKIFLDNVFV